MSANIDGSDKLTLLNSMQGLGFVDGNQMFNYIR